MILFNVEHCYIYANFKLHDLMNKKMNMVYIIINKLYCIMTDCIFLLCNGIQVYLVNLDDVAIEVLNKTKSTNTDRYGYLKYPYEDS